MKFVKNADENTFVTLEILDSGRDPREQPIETAGKICFVWRRVHS